MQPMLFSEYFFNSRIQRRPVTLITRINSSISKIIHPKTALKIVADSPPEGNTQE